MKQTHRLSELKRQSQLSHGGPSHKHTSGIDLLMKALANTRLLKLERRQRSGIDTIEYHTWHRIPHGKVKKNHTIKHHKQEPNGQPFPSRLPQGSNEQMRRHDKKQDINKTNDEVPPWNCQ